MNFISYLKPTAFMGQLDISFLRPINPLKEVTISILGEWSKKIVQQGRSHFGARSVRLVREHDKTARTPLAAFFNIPIIKQKFKGTL